jgi:hypothetical protein
MQLPIHLHKILNTTKNTPLCLHLLFKVNYSFDWQQPFLLLQDKVALKNITIIVSMKAPGVDFRGLATQKQHFLLEFAIPSRKFKPFVRA